MLHPHRIQDGIVRRVVMLLMLIGACAFPHVQTAAAQEGEPDPYRAGRFDAGRMWTFENPPVEYFSETYDFEPDSAWFAEARLGTVRIPGCTASFVTSNGLLLTNHHCGRDWVTAVTQSNESLPEDGFFAEDLEDERAVPGLYADQLIAITDVTDAIRAAEAGTETDAERIQARTDTIEALTALMQQEAGGEEAGMVVEITSLYHGGRYSAYTYKRYSDVRLVFVPEQELGYYGGDADNFTFPRYTLDITFFRVYDGDAPLESDHSFLWSQDGVRSGDPVFVVGNPGTTSRLETVAQLETRNEMTDRSLLHFIVRNLEALEAFHAADPAEARTVDAENLIFSLRNARKAYTGQLEALADSMVLSRRRDAERAFQQSIAADAGLSTEYGGLIDEMATVQEEMRTLASAHEAFLGLQSPAFSSATLRRALLAYAYLSRQEQGEAEDALAPVIEQIRGMPDQPAALDQAFLAARLDAFVEAWGDAEEPVSLILDGDSIEAVASGVVDRSVLSSAATAADALEDGALTMDDPALQLVGAFIDRYREYQSGFAGLNARAEALASRIGQARFSVYDTDIPPDATFTLRIADGVVQGYPYNGTYASPFTSYYGLYDHYYSYGVGSEWELPERWKVPPSDFRLSMPLNFASTNDITGGNSGSPVLNRDLELVGLIFDGNIESLAGAFIYLPETMRSVSVDARGILEALDHMYGADRIVIELIEDELVPSGADAAARTGR